MHMQAPSVSDLGMRACMVAKGHTGWMASAPLLTAAAMMLGMLRYDAELAASPMQTASSASCSTEQVRLSMPLSTQTDLGALLGSGIRSCCNSKLLIAQSKSDMIVVTAGCADTAKSDQSHT